jgi:3-oxoacyl-[acyl-carrier protein] reductase
VARTLLAEGANVVIGARGPDDLAAARAELDALAPGRVEAVVGDLSGEDAAGLVDRSVEMFGAVDIVVLVAPCQPPAAIAMVDDPDALAEAWEPLVGAVRIYQRAARHMRAAGWGRFVHVASSVAKQLPDDDHELEILAGLGMLGFHKVVANELGSAGITANAVLRKSEVGDDGVAAAVAFFASEPGAYLTGVTMTVDAGAGSTVF